MYLVAVYICCSRPKPYKACTRRMSMALTKKEIETDIQEKYIQLQLLKQQATALVEEKANIEERLHEMSMTVDAVKQIGTVQHGSELWSSLGGGAFVRSDIKDTDNVLIVVGAGILIKKNRTQALELLESRFHDVNQFYTTLLDELKKYTAGIALVEESLNELLKSYS